MGIPQWKLDGVLAPGQDFIKIAKLFVNARNEIEAGTWTPEKSAGLELQVRAHHQKFVALKQDFTLLNPEDVK